MAHAAGPAAGDVVAPDLGQWGALLCSIPWRCRSLLLSLRCRVVCGCGLGLGAPCVHLCVHLCALVCLYLCVFAYAWLSVKLTQAPTACVAWLFVSLCLRAGCGTGHSWSRCDGQGRGPGQPPTRHAVRGHGAAHGVAAGVVGEPPAAGPEEGGVRLWAADAGTLYPPHPGCARDSLTSVLCPAWCPASQAIQETAKALLSNQLPSAWERKWEGPPSPKAWLAAVVVRRIALSTWAQEVRDSCCCGCVQWWYEFLCAVCVAVCGCVWLCVCVLLGVPVLLL